MASIFLAGCTFQLGTPSASVTDSAEAPAEWIEVNVGGKFTVTAPPDTTYEPQKGIDSFVGKIQNPSFAMQFDYGRYNGNRQNFDLNEGIERVRIDGKDGTIISYPGNAEAGGSCSNVVALLIPNLNAGSLHISACTGDKENIVLIKRVFKTIRFRKFDRTIAGGDRKRQK